MEVIEALRSPLWQRPRLTPGRRNSIVMVVTRRPNRSQSRRSMLCRPVPLPECAHCAALADTGVGRDERQVVQACSRRDEAIRRVGRERSA